MSIKLSRLSPFYLATLSVCCAVLISYGLGIWIGSSTVVLLILQLSVVVVAFLCRPRWVYIVALLEALYFNFLFTVPRYSFEMFNGDDIINLLVFLLVAVVTSQLSDLYQHQQNQLKQEQLRNSILLSVSHDLRTPLSAIIGTLSTLKEYMGKLSSKQKEELLDSAMVESHRLHQYIENLLQVTKLQHGVVVPKKSQQSIVHIIHLVIDRFTQQKSRLVLQTQDNLPLVNVSSSLIQQAIFNVIDNALRYSPNDKCVTISVRVSQANAQVIVDIQDEGVGIRQDQAESIFELFYSQNSLKRSDSGTGLGLAVAKGILSAHGGTIQAIPLVKGCLIRIGLPSVTEVHYG
ncbi:Sensor histidine kinase YycG [Marinomonas spartinae]|uniref:histidine kinase n=1 Tax=Marinomonas spartinae TaxID=1792290 RepID=A0A1A8T320_9GAMM|nr:ATP-binding protein [Marinomonas spartinae]SBS25116.1 Sensor histidine kinase YycG [Marinomonas spartinae]